MKKRAPGLFVASTSLVVALIACSLQGPCAIGRCAHAAGAGPRRAETDARGHAGARSEARGARRKRPRSSPRSRARASALRVAWPAAFRAASSGVSSAAWPRDHATTAVSRRAVGSNDAFHTEAYDRILDNPFLAAAAEPALHVLDRRRHGLVRQRAPLPAPGPAAAQGRRAHRGAAQLLPLRLPRAARRRRRSRSRPRSRRCPWRPEHRLVLVGLRGRAIEEKSAAAAPAHVPDRRIGLDAVARQAAAAEAGDGAPGRGAARAGPGRDRRLRRQLGAGAAAHLRRPPGRDPRGARRARGRRLDGGRRGHRARLPRGRPRCSSPGAINRVLLATDGDFNVGVTSVGELSRADRGEAQERRLPLGARLRRRATSRTRRWRCSPTAATATTRTSTREAEAQQGAGERGGRHARHDRQGRQDPGRVEPAPAWPATGWSATRTALLRAEDFDDDRKDAGEIGAGHTVTALYEVVPAGLPLDAGPGRRSSTSSRPRRAPRRRGDELHDRQAPLQGARGRRRAGSSRRPSPRAAGDGARLRAAALRRGRGRVRHAAARVGAPRRRATGRWCSSWRARGRATTHEGYRSEFLTSPRAPRSSRPPPGAGRALTALAPLFRVPAPRPHERDALAGSTRQPERHGVGPDSRELSSQHPEGSRRTSGPDHVEPPVAGAVALQQPGLDQVVARQRSQRDLRFPFAGDQHGVPVQRDLAPSAAHAERAAQRRRSALHARFDLRGERPSSEKSTVTLLSPFIVTTQPPRAGACRRPSP